MENQSYILIAVLAALLLVAHVFDGCIDTPEDCREMCNGTPVSFKPGSLNGVGSCVCAQTGMVLDGGAN